HQQGSTATGKQRAGGPRAPTRFRGTVRLVSRSRSPKGNPAGFRPKKRAAYRKKRSVHGGGRFVFFLVFCMLAGGLPFLRGFRALDQLFHPLPAFFPDFFIEFRAMAIGSRLPALLADLPVEIGAILGLRGAAALFADLL